MDFVVLTDHGMKIIENEKRDKYLDIPRVLKKLWNMKVTVMPIFIGALGTNLKRLGKGAKRLRNQKTSGDHPDYSIIKIGQNTEKSPGYLRRLAVTQTPVKDHQLTLNNNNDHQLTYNNDNDG